MAAKRTERSNSAKTHGKIGDCEQSVRMKFNIGVLRGEKLEEL